VVKAGLTKIRSYFWWSCTSRRKLAIFSDTSLAPGNKGLFLAKFFDEQTPPKIRHMPPKIIIVLVVLGGRSKGLCLGVLEFFFSIYFLFNGTRQ
jgi:hypothetical protein